MQGKTKSVWETNNNQKPCGVLNIRVLLTMPCYENLLEVTKFGRERLGSILRVQGLIDGRNWIKLMVPKIPLATKHPVIKHYEQCHYNGNEKTSANDPGGRQPYLRASTSVVSHSWQGLNSRHREP